MALQAVQVLQAADVVTGSDVKRFMWENGEGPRGGCKLLKLVTVEEEERQAGLEGEALDSRQLQECQATWDPGAKVPPRNEAASTPGAGVMASVWGQCGPRGQQGRTKWIKWPLWGRRRFESWSSTAGPPRLDQIHSALISV